MKKATKDDIKRILEYLKRDIANCLYMYIDIMIYGIENQYLDVWYEGDHKGIQLVVMKYHNSFQVYSARVDWNKEPLLKLIKEYNVDAIHGKKSIIEYLGANSDLGEKYETHYGYVLTSTRAIETGMEGKVEMATIGDVPEIARLMCSDEYWTKSYTVEELESQLKERIQTKMGRSFIIRDKGRIIVHNSTFAETSDIAVVAGMIVDKDYRDSMLGPIMELYVGKFLREEGKQIYFFITDFGRAKTFEKLGNKIVAEYGKFVKKV